MTKGVQIRSSVHAALNIQLGSDTGQPLVGLLKYFLQQNNYIKAICNFLVVFCTF